MTVVDLERKVIERPADRITHPLAGTRERAPARRFLALDALRGMAALAVVIYHTQGAFSRGSQPWMPAALASFFREGHFGVDVFFVLSGFVIAYSVRDGAWTMRYLTRFAVKRSLRLDPPYWVAIALEIALISASLAIMPSLSTPVPTRGQVLAHLAYLQGLLGYRQISPIFWTLCYEVQFYVTLVGILVMGETLARRSGPRSRNAVLALVFGALFLVSLGVYNDWLPSAPHGLALDRWFEFFIGALAWWAVAGTVGWPVLVSAWLASVLLAHRADAPIEVTIVLAVSTLCIVSATAPRFDRVFAWRPLQFLGAISYSLYLYHPSISWRIVSLAQHFAGASLSPILGVATWFAAVGGAILFAAVAWRFIERPAQALGRRVTLPRARSGRNPIAVLGASALQYHGD
jgi:peptidoglycan/LPS O-acetylase OafA/YrhL